MNKIEQFSKETSFFENIWPVHSQFILSRAIYVVSKYKIADLLKEGPATPHELSQKLGFQNSANLKRVLKFLESQQIFKFDAQGRVHAEPQFNESVSETIIDDHQRNWTVLKGVKEDKENFLNALAPLAQENEIPLLKMARGYIASRTLFGAVELGLPELLKEGKSLDSLAAHIGTSSKGLSYMLEGLIAMRMVQNNQGLFKLTDRGTLLLDKGGQAFIQHEDEGRWEAIGKMDEVLATGKRYFQDGHYFIELSKQAEKAEISDRAMSFITDYENPCLVPLLTKQLKPGMTVVDVGGGQGKLLTELLKACPGVKGILFDMPSTVARHSIPKELQDRCQIVGGDFFKEIPEGDIYLVKRVMHDWDNAACVKILENCESKMRPGGKVILNELLLPDPVALKIDVLMMNLFDGAERDIGEYAQLLEKAKLELVACQSTTTWLTMMVAQSK